MHSLVLGWVDVISISSRIFGDTSKRTASLQLTTTIISYTHSSTTVLPLDSYLRPTSSTLSPPLFEITRHSSLSDSSQIYKFLSITYGIRTWWETFLLLFGMFSIVTCRKEAIIVWSRTTLGGTRAWVFAIHRCGFSSESCKTNKRFHETPSPAPITVIHLFLEGGNGHVLRPVLFEKRLDYSTDSTKTSSSTGLLLAY